MHHKLNSDEYRRHHDRAHDKAIAAEERCEELQRRRDVEWEIVEASRHGLPGRVLGRDEYIKHKIVLGNIEGALVKAQRKAEFFWMLWDAMPSPTPSRKRRPGPVLVTDGYIRTGRYKTIDGERVPVLEKVE
jgi:hypothetical protein